MARLLYDRLAPKGGMPSWRSPAILGKVADFTLDVAVPSRPEAMPRLRCVLNVWAAMLAGPATVLLVLYARSGTPTLLALSYGIALILVLGTSGLFHTPNWSRVAWHRLQRLDHSMIYVLIAGSYAPFAYRLDAVPRSVVLSIAIGGGLLGWLKVHLWPRAPRLVTSIVYVLIGWCMAPFFPELYANIGLWATCLLVVGGVFYTAAP